MTNTIREYCCKRICKYLFSLKMITVGAALTSIYVVYMSPKCKECNEPGVKCNRSLLDSVRAVQGCGVSWIIHSTSQIIYVERVLPEGFIRREFSQLFPI